MILGGTIGELKQRMTLAEYHTWIAYRHKYGTMNDVRRYDRPAAMLACMVSRLTGGKGDIKDFLPFSLDEDKEASLSDIINVFGGVKIGK